MQLEKLLQHGNLKFVILLLMLFSKMENYLQHLRKPSLLMTILIFTVLMRSFLLNRSVHMKVQLQIKKATRGILIAY